MWRDKFPQLKHEMLTEVIFQSLGQSIEAGADVRFPTFNDQALKNDLKAIDEFWEFDPQWQDEVDMRYQRQLLIERVTASERVNRYVTLYCNKF
ncbi:hypothetical protein QMA56_09650 [Leuconostoc falkenbergense]|uniref:hypothetical protein n=1 Tax=Leuconostoc falkenbergense TaxID=2766470 RepID=UPI0024ADA9D3|nr:hypothetical protein [Leuconostoc falkenbergense]MDI6667967.1 hypothetical protein [Leuconostoc falkenbergense]